MGHTKKIARVGSTRQLAIEVELHKVTIAGVDVTRPSSITPSVWLQFWETVAKLRR